MATVTTSTTTVTPRLGIFCDRGYLYTPYGKYNLILLALNSICFICVVAQPWASYIPPQGWFYFVCVTGFWFCIIDILLGICQVHNRIVRIVPFNLGNLIFHGLWCFFYLTAASAVTHYAANYQNRDGWYGASFFGFLATIAYGVIAYFRYVDWKTAPAASETVTTTVTV